MRPQAVIQLLLDVMLRADPVWCDIHDKTPSDDEQWDAAVAAAEDWLEDNP